MRIVMEQAGFEYRTASDRKIRTPEDAAKACAQVAASQTEAFIVLLLNAKTGMMSSEIVSTGILDATLVHPREVFRYAVKEGAASVVLLHVHPSGDPSPSAEDIRITRQLIEAGRVLGISVMDHVVIAYREKLVWHSMRENGVLDFTKSE